MKITEIRTFISWAGLRNWVLVKVMTDSGLHGWGEATLEGFEETVAACVARFGTAPGTRHRPLLPSPLRQWSPAWSRVPSS